MVRDFFRNLKRLLRGQPAPGRPEPVHPCMVCGDPGFYPVRGGWLCEPCSPPFLRAVGRNANGFTFKEPAR